MRTPRRLLMIRIRPRRTPQRKQPCQTRLVTELQRIVTDGGFGKTALGILNSKTVKSTRRKLCGYRDSR